jgi:hypothetical protein
MNSQTTNFIHVLDSCFKASFLQMLPYISMGQNGGESFLVREVSFWETLIITFLHQSDVSVMNSSNVNAKYVK